MHSFVVTGIVTLIPLPQCRGCACRLRAQTFSTCGFERRRTVLLLIAVFRPLVGAQAGRLSAGDDVFSTRYWPA